MVNLPNLLVNNDNGGQMGTSNIIHVGKTMP